MNVTSGVGSAVQGLNVQSTAQANAVESTKPAASGGVQGGAAVQQNDAASLTSAGLLVGSTGDDVRTEKVAALQQAIASGTYSVPASAVADKLINSMLG